MSKATLTGANTGCNFRTWNQQWTKTQWADIQSKARPLKRITSQKRGHVRRWKKKNQVTALQLTVCGSSPFSGAASACCLLSSAAGMSWTERPSHRGPSSQLQRQREELTYDCLCTERQLTLRVITLKKGNNIMNSCLCFLSQDSTVLPWWKTFNTMFT